MKMILDDPLNPVIQPAEPDPEPDDPGMIAPSDLPTPESSLRPGVSGGTRVRLADGREWILVDFVPEFGGVWDRIYEGNFITSNYRAIDVQVAAARLLMAAHDIPPDFAVWLLTIPELTDPTNPTGDDLARAVEAALFGPADEVRTWSDWAEASLRANGVDPATVPPARLRVVLDVLVMAGRAPDHADFTSAGRAARRRAEILATFERSATPPGRGEARP